MKRLLALLLCAIMVFSLFACNNGSEDPVIPTDSDPADSTPTDSDSADSTPTDSDPADSNPTDSDPADSNPTDSDPADSDQSDTDPADSDPADSDTADTDPVEPDPVPAYELKLEKLDDIMLPILASNNGTVINETVMFLDYGDEKTLLYPIDTVVSVTSYGGEKTYVEGKDYAIVDGKIKILEGSSIPCITRAKYYNTSNSTLKTLYNGSYVNTHWGEGKLMTDWQVNVTYTHTESDISFAQTCQSELFDEFLSKLEAGEDVTIIFFGDSITRGANSSWERNYAPYQYPYTILFTQALADLYGYTVHYIASDVAPEGKPTSQVPSKDYVAGDRGTITYINTAIGGWTSEDAVNNFDAHVKSFVEKYGCDLLVWAFGINDTNLTVRVANKYFTSFMNKFYGIAPTASVLAVSTMVPNPEGLNWYTTQADQEAEFLKTAESLRNKGKVCVIACMTSISQTILEHKTFNDYAGNNINHPNDFLIRIYAQTLLQTLVGYENIK